ncbi:MAG TPA: discoidin domain-containing protein, partial [Gammaproteobacteria bacterium]|nr:discoidin domain-containing protein [Gammaproteobacteria bacterium]
NWLKVDLGKLSNVSGTEVKWGSNSIWKYKIEVSPDEQQWTVALDKTGNTASAQTYSDNFNGLGRYIRITTTNVNPSQRTSIYDFEVFGSQAGPPPTNNPINLAMNKPSTASSQYSNDYGPAMATDADTMLTRWCASNGTNGQWLKVDLGKDSTLVKSRVKWESYGVWKYKVEISSDNVNWKLVVDKTNNTVPSQTYEDLFTGTGRYIRVTATTNQPGHWASLFDFQVFGNQ